MKNHIIVFLFLILTKSSLSQTEEEELNLESIDQQQYFEEQMIEQSIEEIFREQQNNSEFNLDNSEPLNNPEDENFMHDESNELFIDSNY